jgi:subtilase family protein
MAKRRRPSQPRRRARVVSPSRFPTERELIVIAAPEAGLRVRFAAIEGAPAAEADALARLLQRANATMHPIFGATESRARNAMAGLPPVGALSELPSFYKIDVAPASVDALASDLARQAAIEAVYVKPGAEPAIWIDETVAAPHPEAIDAPPVTPDFTARQLYLDAAPGGIDARHAWTRAGGRGAGVRIIDIEGAWRFTHEDLLQNQGGVIGGTQSTDLGWRNHGTAVVGEFGSDNNTFGVTGICPDAGVRAISIFGGVGSAGAIRQAADALGAGDIILIELHRPGPRHNFQSRADQAGYIAVEWWPDDFAAILYATSRGVIVVEAAGNGAENLDDAIYNAPAAGFPASWRNPFNRANPQCGAIIVGAGAPPPGTHGNNHGADRSRLGFSNFGACIDAQGWGREVTTCGYGDLQGGTNEDLWYADRFSGTSSASPIVVGAVGCVQGVLRAAGRPLLTPATARDILRTTGSPQQDEPGRPASQRIGNRPDLRAAIARLLPMKSQLKDLKDIRKEIKEKERKEFKEIKEFKEKELKERKEIKEIKEKDRKEIKEKDKDIFEGKSRDIGPTQPAPVATIEDRVAALEAALAEVAHFIPAELRPDLSTSALVGEGDAEALQAQLEKDAADAKQAKDLKDVEKLREI